MLIYKNDPNPDVTDFSVFTIFDECMWVLRTFEHHLEILNLMIRQTYALSASNIFISSL